MVKVIQAGFIRTATMSFASAMGILASENGEGGSLHGEHMFNSRASFLTWMDIYAGKKKLDEETVYQLLGKDDSVYSVSDMPYCKYYKELLKVYPNAKVVLLLYPGSLEAQLRSGRIWTRCFNTVIQHLSNIFFRPMAFFLYCTGLWIAVKGKSSFEEFLKFVNLFSEDELVQSFHINASFKYLVAINKEHILSLSDEVRMSVPKDQLLEYSVVDGWDPLCNFLGVPVPNVSYPRVDNHSSKMIFTLHVFLWIGALVSIIAILSDIYALVAVVLGYADWKWPFMILSNSLLSVLLFKEKCMVKDV